MGTTCRERHKSPFFNPCLWVREMGRMRPVCCLCRRRALVFRQERKKFRSAIELSQSSWMVFMVGQAQVWSLHARSLAKLLRIPRKFWPIGERQILWFGNMQALVCGINEMGAKWETKPLGQKWVANYDFEALPRAPPEFISPIGPGIDWTASFQKDSDWAISFWTFFGKMVCKFLYVFVMSIVSKVEDSPSSTPSTTPNDTQVNPELAILVLVLQWVVEKLAEKNTVRKGVFLKHLSRFLPAERQDGWDHSWNEGKDRLLLWLVSKCGTTERNLIFQELESYLPSDRVHKYGGCSELKDPCQGDLKLNETCLEKFTKRYKFYAAFENTRCEDYITEKFWKSLRLGMVPVCWGGRSRKDYERIAPGSSFIHVDDFASIKELAQYLLKVDKDPHLGVV